MNYPSRLSAKCAAVNRANSEAKRLFPLVLSALSPFIGRKVIKTDCTLTNEARKALPALPRYDTTGNELTAYVHASAYNVKLTVRCSLGDHPNRGDHETTCYLFDLEGQNAKQFTDNRDWIADLRTDYTPDEIAALRTMAQEAANVARQAEAACHPFGLFDH